MSEIILRYNMPPDIGQLVTLATNLGQATRKVAEKYSNVKCVTGFNFDDILFDAELKSENPTDLEIALRHYMFIAGSPDRVALESSICFAIANRVLEKRGEYLGEQEGASRKDYPVYWFGSPSFN